MITVSAVSRRSSADCLTPGWVHASRSTGRMSIVVIARWRAANAGSALAGVVDGHDRPHAAANTQVVTAATTADGRRIVGVIRNARAIAGASHRRGIGLIHCGGRTTLYPGNHGYIHGVRLAALLMTLAACAQPRSARCKEICAREAECQQQAEDETPDEQSAFDEGDCVAACAALERDSTTAQ